MYLTLNKEHFTFDLQYKHSGTFASCKYEELSYPKNQKMCDPILVTDYWKCDPMLPMPPPPPPLRLSKSSQEGSYIKISMTRKSLSSLKYTESQVYSLNFFAS